MRSSACPVQRAAKHANPQKSEARPETRVALPEVPLVRFISFSGRSLDVPRCRSAEATQQVCVSCEVIQRSPTGCSARSKQYFLLAFGDVQFVAEVLGCRVHEPVSVDQAQTPHVAAGRVQQLVEDHVGRLTLEEDGRGVDGHGLVGVHGQVAAVKLKLRGVDEHPVCEAAPNVPRVRPARLELQVQLEKQSFGYK